jgi:hypothetical protein
MRLLCEWLLYEQDIWSIDNNSAPDLTLAVMPIWLYLILSIQLAEERG